LGFFFFLLRFRGGFVFWFSGWSDEFGGMRAFELETALSWVAFGLLSGCFWLGPREVIPFWIVGQNLSLHLNMACHW
jgi:hypothetical protein